MSKVIVKNGNVEGALRTMKQKNARDGLLKKARERQEELEREREKEREKVNIRRLRVIMAILSLITSGYLILKLPGCDILPRFADTVIYLIIIFTVVILANTWCIKK